MMILVASPISSSALKALASTHQVRELFHACEDELVQEIVNADVLVFRSGVQISRSVLEAAQQLQLIIRAGSGLDNIDLSAVQERNIALVRVQSPGARAVAEMSFALMLGLARQIRVADREIRQGIWLKHELNGAQLKGKSLGIVGLGNIGTMVGEMGQAWGMKVIACVKNPTSERVRATLVKGIELSDMQTVFAQADFISLHLPLSPTTNQIVNRELLLVMKRTAFLVNLARGGVVDELALLDLLEKKLIAGAALDVHTTEGNGSISKLAHLDNVLLTPHIGASTIDAQEKIGTEIVSLISQLENDLK